MDHYLVARVEVRSLPGDPFPSQDIHPPTHNNLFVIATISLLPLGKYLLHIGKILEPNMSWALAIHLMHHQLRIVISFHIVIIHLNTIKMVYLGIVSRDTMVGLSLGSIHNLPLERRILFQTPTVPHRIHMVDRILFNNNHTEEMTTDQLHQAGTQVHLGGLFLLLIPVLVHGAVQGIKKRRQLIKVYSV
jgi:hypothetical protein